MKLTFLETYALETAIGSLEVLISLGSVLTDKQKADIARGLADLQQIQSDFANGRESHAA